MANRTNNTQNDRPGIPGAITIKTIKKWIEPRVSPKRLAHVEGVALVAVELAQLAGCDPFVAEIGGWLHDACKEHNQKQLVVEAREFGLQLNTIEEANGQLLHGPVGALTAKRELGITDQVLLDAISEHTLGAINMTPLSQILFLADCLEESRPRDFTDPIWQALGYEPQGTPGKRKFVGPLDMDAAILVACDLSLKGLLEDRRVIHPKTVEVRNWYLYKITQRQKAGT